MSVIQCKDLHKSFGEGGTRVDVLKGVNFSIEAGEYHAILGRSGSGKTTLLHMLAGLDRADSGSVEICGNDLARLDDKSLARVRNQHIGFVYQFHHLLPEFSVLENAMMPGLIAKLGAKTAQENALAILDAVGLSARLKHRPSELSGGERQRVAIARALVNKPDCVLADEPTGNLDEYNASLIHELMMQLNQDYGVSFLLVTHDEQLASGFQKKWRMQDGVLLASES